MNAMNVNSISATVRNLQAELLDKQRKLAPPSMLDCAAHMLLYFESQDTVHRIALQFLLEKFEATRANLGYGDPAMPQYVSSAIETAPGIAVPLTNQPLPNHIDSVQRVWRSPTTVCLDPRNVPGIEKIWAPVGTKAKLARRMETERRIFGLVCIDDTVAPRQWKASDAAYLDQFVMCFLGPILDSYKTTLFPKLSALTSAEIAVIRLAIRGFTYKEIASALAKSTNTIDNQLRSARAKLRVRNQVELVQACSGLLCR
jgi:DNA-binding CsgD family transcriptional regulator